MYTAPSLTPEIDHLSVHLALEHAGPRPVPDRPQICLRSLFEKEAEDIIAIFSLTLLGMRIASSYDKDAI